MDDIYRLVIEGFGITHWIHAHAHTHIVRILPIMQTAATALKLTFVKAEADTSGHPHCRSADTGWACTLSPPIPPFLRVSNPDCRCIRAHNSFIRPRFMKNVTKHCQCDANDTNQECFLTARSALQARPRPHRSALDLQTAPHSCLLTRACTTRSTSSMPPLAAS